MKKSAILLVRTLCIIFMIGLSSCGETKTNPDQKKIEVVAPSQIITVTQAESFYKNYSKRRVPLIQKFEDSVNNQNRYGDSKQQKTILSNTEKIRDSFIVARYVSYDYKTIKAYLAYVEQEAKKADVEVSSLRFYFSNYPDKKEFENGEMINHPRQNSIMISPTLEKDGEEFLFYTSNLDEEKSQAVLISDSFEYLNERGLGEIYDKNEKVYASFSPPKATKLIQSGENSLTMNRGNGSPPNNN